MPTKTYLNIESIRPEKSNSCVLDDAPMKKNKEVSVEKLLGVKTQKSTTKFTQGNKHDKRNRKKTPRRSKNQGSLCVYLLPERRKYVPVGALFLLFCCIVYFKFSHIRLESVWDNVPTVSNTASSNVDFEQAQSVNTVNKEDAAATLVGNFQLHNLHKIELGIDLNEPISMSQADYVERSDSQIDDGERPYQHDFDWYEDYYNSFADEHVKVKIVKYSHLKQFIAYPLGSKTTFILFNWQTRTLLSFLIVFLNTT